MREEILDKGFDAERGTFTQHYDTTEVDASLLTIPLVGFLPGDDPRVLGTIEAIEEDLMRDGLLLRYRTQTGVDGLVRRRAPVPGLLVLAGLRPRRAPGAATRRDELMDRLCALANDVGLLSEEYDAGARADGRQLPAGVQPPRRWCRRRWRCGDAGALTCRRPGHHAGDRASGTAQERGISCGAP